MRMMVATQFNGQIFIIYFAVILLAFYFLIFRPNKKQQSRFDQMLESLKVGDDVITKSGVKGKVVEVDDVYFTLETGNGAQITYVINALNYIVTPVDGVEDLTIDTEDRAEEFEKTTEDIVGEEDTKEDAYQDDNRI